MLLPHVKEVEQIMQLFGRAYLKFDVSLQRSQVGPNITHRTYAPVDYRPINRVIGTVPSIKICIRYI